jgi:hypothetical protein
VLLTWGCRIDGTCYGCSLVVTSQPEVVSWRHTPLRPSLSLSVSDPCPPARSGYVSTVVSPVFTVDARQYCLFKGYQP